jgi:hypothetical protein
VPRTGRPRTRETDPRTQRTLYLRPDVSAALDRRADAESEEGREKQQMSEIVERALRRELNLPVRVTVYAMPPAEGYDRDDWMTTAHAPFETFTAYEGATPALEVPAHSRPREAFIGGAAETVIHRDGETWSASRIVGAIKDGRILPTILNPEAAKMIGVDPLLGELRAVEDT